MTVASVVAVALTVVGLSVALVAIVAARRRG